MMKSTNMESRPVAYLRLHLIVTALLVFTFALTGKVQAQYGDEGEKPLRVDRMFIRNVRSPNFNTGILGVPTDENLEWLQIAVRYQTRTVANRRWLDEMTLNWHLAMVTKEEEYGLVMHEEVTYADIDLDDKDHYAVVYVRPAILERYYPDGGDVKEKHIRIYLEFSVNNNTLVTYYFPEDIEKPAKPWWQWGAPKVLTRPNELQSRDETPFAPLEYEALEHIKTEQD